MNIEDFIPQGEQKMRIVQELVPEAGDTGPCDRKS